ncbi:hypothetical protein CEXT_33201 [Caerostris extrusa]|uniref:Uncharacterized protein n=1 Tax=Caerostris extrusa TaxID=172846 RepID=A0AAV4XE15_CAEEX|nr:hypothetical protein CEXT_33201 [Caerostris extrusa]
MWQLLYFFCQHERDIEVLIVVASLKMAKNREIQEAPFHSRRTYPTDRCGGYGEHQSCCKNCFEKCSNYDTNCVIGKTL